MKDGKIVVGVIGCGTVGLAVIRQLLEHLAEIEKKIGCRIKIVACDSSEARRRLLPEGIESFSDRTSMHFGSGIDIIVELIGGTGVAREVIMAAINHGQHVVTANKAVIAKHGPEIFKEAYAKGLMVYFEASVLAGVPVLQGINEGLAGNKILGVSGILNGTCNFILTQMAEKGMTYYEALELAQEKGFAESDPSSDVGGADTANKLSIMASLATGKWILPDSFHVEGIVGIDYVDMQFAEKMGYGIKLLGVADLRDLGYYEAEVRPYLVPKSSPFFWVSDAYNWAIVEGDYAGDVVYGGRGAGGKEASSGVVSDIIYVARAILSGTAGKQQYVSCDDQEPSPKIVPYKDMEGRFYLRILVEDKPGALGHITNCLAKNGVSIQSVEQEEEGRETAWVFITTKVVREMYVIEAAADMMQRSDLVIQNPFILKILD